MFKSFKKNPRFILHIYFVSFLFLIQFSTNHIKAETFNIDNVEVKEPYDINFNKPKVVDKAFNKAFKELFLKITSSSDHEIINNFNILSIKSLVDSFTIVEEKFVNQNYVAIFDVDFDKKKIMNFLEEKNIFPSIPIEKQIFILPILIDTNSNELVLFNKNVFYSNWNKENKKYYLLNYILPNEDLEDIKLLQSRINNIEDYEFSEIISKYNLEDYIIVIFFKNYENLKIFSKINLNSQLSLVNSEYKNINISKNQNIETIIDQLKSIYENHWKKINQINTSIKLSATLMIDSKDHELINKFENRMFDIDFISKFNIENFTSKKITYKIIYNSTPDKFLKLLNLNGFKVDTSTETWKIYE